MGNPLVRFCEGQESNCDMEKILWHCRESRQKQRKQTFSYSHGGSCLLEKLYFPLPGSRSLLEDVDHLREAKFAIVVS